MKVTLFDYGAGNIHSLSKAIASRPGVALKVETDPRAALDTDVLVLPGVGAFGAAAERLSPARREVREALERGLPCLGICLGMQLLFDRSEEGAGEGLGFLPGEVTRLRAQRVPHIGWNTLEGGCGVPGAPLETVYYANSFACRPEDPSSVVSWTTLEGDRFAAVVRKARTLGVQFHPEKSSAAGVSFIQRFLDEVAT